MSQFLKIARWDSMQILFAGLVLSLLVGIVGGILTESYALFGLPILFLGAFLVIVDFRKVFYLLLISLSLIHI